MERRAAKGIFNLSSVRYRQSVQQRPNSNMTEKQIPENFNSVLLQKSRESERLCGEQRLPVHWA